MLRFLHYAPLLGAGLNLVCVACFVYLGDWPRAFYWGLAAGLSVSTIYMR